MVEPDSDNHPAGHPDRHGIHNSDLFIMGILPETFFGLPSSVMLLLRVIMAVVLIGAWKWSHPKLTEVNWNEFSRSSTGIFGWRVNLSQVWVHHSAQQQFCRECGAALK